MCLTNKTFTLSNESVFLNILVTAMWALLGFITLLNLIAIYVLNARKILEKLHCIVQGVLNSIALVLFTIAFIENCIRVNCLHKSDARRNLN
nr:hypothetical protein [Olive leaf yellowing-associated virus]